MHVKLAANLFEFGAHVSHSSLLRLFRRRSNRLADRRRVPGVKHHQRFLAAQNTASLTTWLAVLDELAALKPAHVVPSHGKLGDATLIARDRAFIVAVQSRVGALKKEGKSVEDAVAAVIAEIAPQYPEFGNVTNAGAMARAAYAEAK